ncbi:FimV/HubP family polar landmark protein [Pseudomonas benzenivorans]|uniref:FimV/HubP family polar landmark protein n=1 Tax=Pseudomonas benzenivorans TaxID=556533 RepID=UPI003F8106F9
MARVRHLLLGLASSSALYSGLVPALGLGEITLHSALNQPLEADIELLEVDDLGADDLKVRLAPAEVFSRSGVDRLYFLNDLRFTPLLRGGSGVIRVRSNQPVREPYLNFIVEVARPNGRLLREYTLLLDPPGSSAYRTVAVAPAAPVTRVRAKLDVASAVPSASRPKPAASLDARYQVVRGDSLWKIAARLRTEGSQASQQALMDEIHALNPQAFAGGDANRLLANVELLLPDSAAAVQQTRTADAAPEPAVESQVATAAEAPASEPLDPQIELILQTQRRVEQELAAQAAETLQLQQQLAEAQAQVQQLQAQMDSKDQQLAVLQAQLADAGQLSQAQPVVAPQTAEAPVLAESGAPDAIQGRNWVGAGFAALLLLLASIAGLLWRSSRRHAEKVAEAQTKLEPQVVAMDADEDTDLSPAVQQPKVARQKPQVQVPAAAPVRQAPAADALEGVDIYIAYGRFGEAAAVLRDALDAQPERNDLRFRLMEVLAQQGDVQGFAEQEAIFREDGDSASSVDELKTRYPQLGTEPAIDALEDAVLDFEDAPVPAKSSAPVSSAEELEDFQLNLDDLSLDADWDLVTPFESPASKKAAADDEQKAQIDDAPRLGSPFAGSMLVEEAPAEDWSQDELDENFRSQPQVSDSPLMLELDHLASDPENLTKLNLALAYIEQGSLESALDILNEVISEGDEAQKQQALELLAKIA